MEGEFARLEDVVGNGFDLDMEAITTNKRKIRVMET